MPLGDSGALDIRPQPKYEVVSLGILCIKYIKELCGTVEDMNLF